MDQPAWSFGNRQIREQVLPGPGPAAYSIPAVVASDQDRGKKGFTFGSSNREQHQISLSAGIDVPDPSAYNTRPKKHGPSFSFGMRIQADSNTQRDKRETPGPSQYAPRVTSAAPKYSFGTKTAFDPFKSDISPGPGAYALSGKLGARTTKGVRMVPPANPHSDDRTPIRANGVPGPSSYVPGIEQARPAAPAYTFGMRTTGGIEGIATARGAGPGPGYYNTRNGSQFRGGPGTNGSKTYLMRPGGDGRGPGGPRRYTEGPGPGAYYANASAAQTKAPAFSLSGTRTDNANLLGNKNQTPGPGEYIRPYTAPKTGIHKGGPVMRGNARADRGNPGGWGDAPGPGAYDTTKYKSTGGNGRTGGISLHARTTGFLDMQGRDGGPGPGAYLRPTDVDGGRSKARMTAGLPGQTTFGAERRFKSLERKSIAPGPSAYGAVTGNRQRTSAPSFSFGAKTSEIELEDTRTMYRPIRNRRGDNAFIGRRAFGRPPFVA